MRIYGLDILRAYAIISVVMIHFGSVINVALPGFPYIPMIDGVELFFVLSGFLIGSILIREYEKKGFNWAELANFWKRRWFRTLPNYYLFLAVNLLLAYFSLNQNNFDDFNWKFFFFLQNLDWHFVGFFWESWSLAVEEWFYLLIPIALLLAHFIFKVIEFKKKCVFLSVILFFILVPLLYRWYVGRYETYDWFWFDVKYRKVVSMRLDTIMYGVLASFVKFYFQSFWEKRRYVFLAIGLLMYYLSFHIEADFNSIYKKVFLFPYMSLMIAFLLPFFDSIKSGKGVIFKSVTHISKISYSMYLIHMGCMIQVFHKNWEITSKTQSLLVYISLWTILIIVSSLVYTYYEKPLTKLRERF